MNADKITAITTAASTIVAAVSLLIGLAERLMRLAGVPDAEVRDAVDDARQRADAAKAKLDAALDGSDRGDG